MANESNTEELPARTYHAGTSPTSPNSLTDDTHLQHRLMFDNTDGSTGCNDTEPCAAFGGGSK